MDPQLSGFMLGLLLGVAKIGFVGSVGFGIAWWRAQRRIRRLEAQLPEAARLEERLASLEQMSEYSAGQLDRLVESQDAIVRQLGAGQVTTHPPELQ